MLSYSRWLARSLSVIVATVALSLAAAAYWQQKIQQGNETIFQPVARIEQAKQILQQMELLRPGLTPNKNESTLDVDLEASEQKIANCTLRQQAVLQGRLILALGISRQQSAHVGLSPSPLPSGRSSRKTGPNPVNSPWAVAVIDLRCTLESI